jgi:hypothetical protein
LSDAKKTESAQIEKTGVEKGDSEIAKGVMDRIVRFQTYAICKLKNEFALLGLPCFLNCLY